MILKINEIFESIQGEGRYQGVPVIFIRLAGCTRKCDFCDTKYHINYVNMSSKVVAKKIVKSNKSIVVWTGGEPLMQIEAINEVICILQNTSKTFHYHIETNGDILKVKRTLKDLDQFDYICISPKEVNVAKVVSKLLLKPCYWYREADIKVVTDCNKLNINMLKYATMLMPLTVYNIKKDKAIRQRVWTYCVNNNIFYSARLHTTIWGKTRKI